LAAELKSLRIFTVQTMSISADARQSTTATKYNVACDPHNSGLSGIDVAIANFDLHTTERKAYIGPGVIETSGKPDGLLVGGLT
jgi:hypothetical protein